MGGGPGPRGANQAKKAPFGAILLFQVAVPFGPKRPRWALKGPNQALKGPTFQEGFLPDFL